MPAAEFAVVNESLLLIIQYLFAHIKNTLAMYKVQTAPRSSESETTPQPHFASHHAPPYVYNMKRNLQNKYFCNK